MPSDRGERLEQHQPLAVLDSPDLQTAYADYGRGKVQLALSEQNRDRLRLLGTRGASLKKISSRRKQTSSPLKLSINAPKRVFDKSALTLRRPKRRAY